MAYVLRYGGAIEESTHECDAALALDSGDFMLRSCAFTFDQMGNYTRAKDFLLLDAGSVWGSDNLMRHYAREGKLSEAKEITQKFKDNLDFRMMTMCLENASPDNLLPVSRQYSTQLLADPDPEPRYIVAADFLFCGQNDVAMQLLKSSIAGHYCAYSGLQNDSALAKLRERPDFPELLSAAKQCRDNFLSERSQAAQ